MMQRTMTRSAFLMVAMTASAIAILTQMHPAHADTLVPGGGIATDTTWTVSGSPYIVQGNLDVNSNVTFTIQPGVQVRLSPGVVLGVSGNATLIAQGTQSAPILFTSAQPIPQPGDWGNIVAVDGSHVRLQYCDIGYGGTGVFVFDELSIRASDVQVSDCIIHHSSSDGIRMPYPFISPHIQNTRIQANAKVGLHQGNSNMNPVYRNVTISGNGTDGLNIDGSNVFTNVVLDGGPDAINGAIVNVPTIGVTGGGVLTITPGTTLALGQDALIVVGSSSTLIAQGTPTLPITFTSGLTTPVPGSWRTLRIDGGAHARLSYCDIAFGGQQTFGGVIALEIDATDVVVDSCRIHNNQGGIYLGNKGISPTLQNTRVDANGGPAIIQVSPDMNPTYRNMTLTGNGMDGVVLHGGDIARDVTLDSSPTALNGSPIYVSAIYVAGNRTLTITPGSTIKMASAGLFQVQESGGLVAQGTPTQPITITAALISTSLTSLTDNWGSIYLLGALTRARLAYCDIGYGGNTYLNGILNTTSSDVQVNHCRIHHSARNGVYIQATASFPNFQDVTLDHNALAAVLQARLGADPVYSHLTLSDNGTDAVIIGGGAINERITLEPTRYQFGETSVISSGQMILLPGTELTFREGGFMNIAAGGQVVALGTQAALIRFTSAFTAPAPGNWLGLTAQAGAKLQLAHCVIEYANAGLTAFERLFINTCTFRRNTSGLVVGSAAGGTIYNSAIYSNTSYGINNTTPTTPVRALSNGWGSPTGPQHATNPGGLGDRVSNGVLFAPWQLAPTFNLATRSALTVAIGTTVHRTLASGGLDDFVVQVPTDANLIVEVRPVAPITAAYELLGQAGALPLPDADAAELATREAQSPDGFFRLIVPRTQAGSYYFTVLPQANSSVTYDFAVYTVTNHLFNVAPMLAAAAPATLHATGVFRVNQQAVRVCNASAPSPAPTGTLVPLGAGEGTLNINLSGVAAGTYNLCVAWPDGSQQTLSNALQIDPATSKQLSVHIELPEFVRLGRRYTGWLVYKNSGTAPLASPAFYITATGATLSLFPEGSYADGLRVNGFANQVPFDKLTARVEQRVPIYFETFITATLLRLNYVALSTDSDQPFNWSAYEPRFKPQPAPANWAQRWSAVTTAIGSTWGSVIQRINSMAGRMAAPAEPPSLDRAVGYLLSVMLSDTVTTPADSYFDQLWCRTAAVDAYDPTTDVQLLDFDATAFDPSKFTFFIAHGNDENVNASGFIFIRDSVKARMAALGYGAINVIRLNWANGAAGASPWQKTRCLNAQGQSRIASAGRAFADKLQAALAAQGKSVDCTRLTVIGHELGNDVLYEMARNLCGNAKPNMILLGITSRFSGIATRDYGLAFDRDHSLGVWTDSPRDNAGAPGLVSLFKANTPDGITFQDASLSNSQSAHPSIVLDWSFSGWWNDHIFPIIQGVKDIYGYLYDHRDDGGTGAQPSVTCPVSGTHGLSNLQVFTNLAPSIQPGSIQQINATPNCGSTDTKPVRSVDPNLKVAWSRRADHGDYVRYTIYFENAKTASAPAQDVFVTDNLPPQLDASSVRLLEVSFGDQVLPLALAMNNTSMAQSVQRTVAISDYRPAITTTLNVNIIGSVDPGSNMLTWAFHSLDPATGQPPQDALAGFLPPNDSSGRGDGSVTFEARIKPQTQRNTVITNAASIVFDTNAAIHTPASILMVGPPIAVYLPLVRR